MFRFRWKQQVLPAQILLLQTNCLCLALHVASAQSMWLDLLPGNRRQSSPLPSLWFELSGCWVLAHFPHLVKFQGLQSVHVQFFSWMWSVPPTQISPKFFSWIRIYFVLILRFLVQQNTALFSTFLRSFVRPSVTGVTYQLFSIFWRFIPWKPYIFWMHII